VEDYLCKHKGNIFKPEIIKLLMMSLEVAIRLQQNQLVT